MSGEVVIKSDESITSSIQDRWERLGERVQARLLREMAAQGDNVDRELLKLQHDLCDLLHDSAATPYWVGLSDQVALELWKGLREKEAASMPMLPSGDALTKGERELFEILTKRFSAAGTLLWAVESREGGSSL